MDKQEYWAEKLYNENISYREEQAQEEEEKWYRDEYQSYADPRNFL